MPVKQTCRISGKEFIISDFEIALLDKISPIIGGEKMTLPLPSLCPDERLRRRAQFKNYFFLHKRICDKTGQEIVSTFGNNSDSTVWNQPSWWSDDVDWHAYGEDIDWSKNFNEQCRDFMRKVPQTCLDNAYKLLENSEYVNGNGKSKDCYLVSCGSGNEKCLYGYFAFEYSSLLNCNYARFSENSSYSTHIWKSYDVHFSFNISECRNTWYSLSCEGSQYLLGCVGIKNGKYQILNVPCTEDEFITTLAKLRNNKEFKKIFENNVLELIAQVGIEKNILTGSTDSSGDFCYDSKNALECFGSSDVEDCIYLQDCYDTYDSMDITNWGENTQLSYDCIAIGQNASNYYFCQGCWGNSSYNFYSQNCEGSSYIFGCSGLKNQNYCIFNKQYSKDDWEINVKKIIKKMAEAGEWGEFFDPKYAWYPYDASYAMTLFPLTKEEVLTRGLEWSGYESKPEGITKTIPAEKLPDDITIIPDDVLNWAIICQKTRKPYKIQPLELDMHRRFGIPLPKTHPLERINILFKWDKRIFSFDF